MMQKETMEQMLTDVLDQFGPNPKKFRCINDQDICLYNPPIRSKSVGCAIGMYLSTKKAQELDDLGYQLEYIYDMKYLPKWMLKLPVEFLADLQNLHDIISNWNIDGKGLTNKGTKNVTDIIKRFDLNFKHKYYKP